MFRAEVIFIISVFFVSLCKIKLNMSYKFLFILTLGFVFSCSTSDKSINMSNTEKVEGKWERVSVPIVEKPRDLKSGKETSEVDYYIRRSIADYYIKFCESEVTKEDFLVEYNKTDDDFIRTMQIEIQLKSGELDKCDDSPVQSRIGEYVIVRFPK